MSQPPEITEHLTDTQRLAHDITTAHRTTEAIRGPK